MKLSRKHIGLAAIVVAAFAAGRFTPIAGDSIAVAQNRDRDSSRNTEQQPQLTAEQQAEMAAWMRARTPGEHHKVLDGITGSWSGEFRIWMEPDTDPIISTGTINREWVLGNRFVKESVEATMDEGTFQALGYVGYSNIDGCYQSTWMENMSTGIMTENGTYNPNTKVMTFYGEHRNPVNGELIFSRGQIDLSQPNKHVYTSYQVKNGKEFKSFEGTVTRVGGSNRMN